MNQLTWKRGLILLRPIVFTIKYNLLPSLQVLNSGGQLQISRPAPEPPRTNGGSNVYQQPHQVISSNLFLWEHEDDPDPHQHVNSNGTYGEYGGQQRQSEEEG